MQLWEKYGYTSYLCGNPGQCTPDAMKVLFDVSKNQNLKVVVLESNVIYDDVSIAIPFTRIVYEILPISEFHDRWRTIGIKDIFSKIEYTSTDYLRGYYPKAKLVDPADASDYMKYTDEKEEISKRGKVYLKIMNEYCKMNNTKFIIMSVPSTKNWNYKKHNAVKEFCDGEGIEFIDFNILADELKIDWNNDTLDAGDHMNYYGSTKLTNYFGKYLTDNNLLESHKDDPEYNNWNEDLIKYKKDMEEL